MQDTNRKNLIKALLDLKGLTVSGLADKIGIPEWRLSFVISGKRPLLEAQQQIADILDLPYEFLWGSDAFHTLIIIEDNRKVNVKREKISDKGCALEKPTRKAKN